MKNIITLTLALFCLIQVSAQEKKNKTEIKWLTLEQAQEASKKDGKPILVDIHTVWCGPCKMLSKITFKDSAIVAYMNENFHAVKFNAEGNDVVKFNGVTYKNPNYNPANAKKRNAMHQLTAKMQVRAYPTIKFIDNKGEIFRTELGYLDPQRMMPVLKEIIEKKK